MRGRLEESKLTLRKRVSGRNLRGRNDPSGNGLEDGVNEVVIK